MKAYKGFNRDMTCRGFQYAEGQSYEMDGEPEVCKRGFHACANPLECLSYYEPGKSVYHEVELDGDVTKSDSDTKCAATKIKIGARLSISALCQAAFEYVRSHCTNEKNAKPGKPATAGDSGAATAGDSGAATAGDYGAATAGDYGAATAGYKGAATAGYKGAATAGDKGAATAGDSGAATAGDSGAATAGDSGAATARGSISVGKNGVGCVRGNNVRARGGMGAILVMAEEFTDNYDIAHHATITINGKRYKPDTWYCLNDKGLVVEAPAKKEAADE